MLETPSVAAQLSETRAVVDVELLARFYRMMNHEPERVCYGLGHVSIAHAQYAVCVCRIAVKQRLLVLES